MLGDPLHKGTERECRGEGACLHAVDPGLIPGTPPCPQNLAEVFTEPEKNP